MTSNILSILQTQNKAIVYALVSKLSVHTFNYMFWWRTRVWVGDSCPEGLIRLEGPDWFWALFWNFGWCWFQFSRCRYPTQTLPRLRQRKYGLSHLTVEAEGREVVHKNRKGWWRFNPHYPPVSVPKCPWARHLTPQFPLMALYECDGK